MDRSAEVKPELTMQDVLSYVRACWDMARSFELRSKALLGLATALVTLPLVWAASATLEPPFLALWWLAAWLVASSALLVFMLSPMFVWHNTRRANADLAARMKTLEAPKRGKLDFDYAASGHAITVTSVDADHATIECLVCVKNFSPGDFMEDVRVSLVSLSSAGSRIRTPIDGNLAAMHSAGAGGASGVRLYPLESRSFRLVAVKAPHAAGGPSQPSMIIAPGMLDQEVVVSAEEASAFTLSFVAYGRNQSPADGRFELSFAENSVISFGLLQKE
jgi:hypothetical protein